MQCWLPGTEGKGDGEEWRAIVNGYKGPVGEDEKFLELEEVMVIP